MVSKSEAAQSPEAGRSSSETMVSCRAGQPQNRTGAPWSQQRGDGKTVAGRMPRKNRAAVRLRPNHHPRPAVVGARHSLPTAARPIQDFPQHQRLANSLGTLQKPNDLPRRATIGHTLAGLAGKTGGVIEVTDFVIERLLKSLGHALVGLIERLSPIALAGILPGGRFPERGPQICLTTRVDFFADEHGLFILVVILFEGRLPFGVAIGVLGTARSSRGLFVALLLLPPHRLVLGAPLGCSAEEIFEVAWHVSYLRLQRYRQSSSACRCRR
jgi:hypothetical protein